MADARTLSDYWEGHGHSGPSHGAERDAIAWGTPGDFDRCVALVTEHGHMTPEQAKGYCNLRHHGALGYWPAQHAEMDRGKMLVTKAADGSDEARVPAGSGRTSGEFTSGSDGPSTAPKKPNPYRKGGPLASKSGSKSKKKTAGGKSGSKKESGSKGGRSGSGKSDAAKLSSLRSQLDSLESQRTTIKQEIVSGTASTKTGTSSSVASGTTASSPSSSSPASTSSGSSSSGSSSSSSSDSSSSTKTVSQLKQQLASINQQIAQVKAQIKQLKQQQSSSSGGSSSNKSVGVRNPRESLTGRFRTFQGEIAEAKQAMAEGRMSDVVDLLGSARALAQTSQQRMVLSELQASIGRAGATSHIIPQVTKVGPHGYIHGWIKVDTAGDVPVRKNEVVSAEHAEGTVTGMHEGLSRGLIKIRDASGTVHKAPSSSVRRATPEEYIDHVNSNWQQADTPEKKREHISNYGPSLPSLAVYQNNEERQRSAAKPIRQYTPEEQAAHAQEVQDSIGPNTAWNHPSASRRG